MAPGPDIPIPVVFDGLSTNLKTTKIVAVLEAPIDTGTNLIWCASFACAWKALQQDLAKEPVTLEGNPETVRQLNDGRDPRTDVPLEGFYATAGRNKDGIVQQIQREMEKRFLTQRLPSFPEGDSIGFVAYTYLEASLKFPLPYNQNQNPLEFTSGSGLATKINSFGLPREDCDTFFQLRDQVRILFYKCTLTNSSDGDFAIDLCTNSTPSQIILAKIRPETNLLATLEAVEKEIHSHNRDESDGDPYYVRHDRSLGPSDTLLVPDLNFFISHHFSELEHRRITNKALLSGDLFEAQQDIRFRLDKSGVDLKSQAVEDLAPAPMRYVFDRPFLIYMKKRGAQMPYFVMWVDNSELLSPFVLKDTNAVEKVKIR